VIAERIGSGAMGVVYAARDPQLNRTVAVKLLRTGTGSDAHASAARLLREARAMAQLVHPNVVTVYDAGQVGDRVFIAMERVRGGTLATCLAQRGPDRDPGASWQRVLALCVRAGHGLAAAHRAGLIHRDFKPDNVLVSDDGEVKVTDLGLARAEVLANDAPNDDAVSRSPVLEDGVVAGSLATADGTLLGTPAYMAPEQMRCEPATVRSDVFSFCATTYECLYGLRPFQGATLMALLDGIMRGCVRPPPAGTPVPSAVRRVLLRGLRADPAERHTSVDEVLSELARAARRPWMRIGAMAAVPVALIVAVAILVHPGWIRRGPVRSVHTGAGPRPSVAVVGIVPEVLSASEAWVEPVLGEQLAGELGAGERLRIIPRETVWRLRRDFNLPHEGPASPESVARLAAAAGADMALVGTYRVADGRLEVRASLRDGRDGRALASIDGASDLTSIPALVTRIDQRVRETAGADAASPLELAAAHAALPAPGDALRLYATGVTALADGQLTTARDALARSVALDDRSPLAHGALATTLVRVGRREDASREANLALARLTGLGRADQLSLEGIAFEAQRRWQDAIDTYKALLRFYPDEVGYAFRLVTVQTYGERWADAYASIASLRARPPPAGDDPRIDWMEARVADVEGDYAHDERSADEAARKADARGERLLQADARAEQAWALVQLGNRARAREVNEQAARLYDEMGMSQDRSSFCLRIAAMVDEAELDYGRALDEAQRALSLVRAAGDATRLLPYLMSVGGLHALVGEISRSIGDYEEAVALARDGPQRANEAVAQSNLGLLYTLAGRLDLARASLAEAVRIDGELGSRREYYHLAFRAYLELLSGDLAAARTAAEASARLAHGVSNPGAEADALRALALVQHEQDQADAAARTLDHARELLPEASSQLADIEVTRAALALDDGHGAEAAERALEAEEKYRRGHAADEAAKAAALACRGLLQRKDVAGAQDACRRADERAATTEALDVAVRTAIAHAELADEQGHGTDAQGALDAASARATSAGAFGLALEVQAAAAHIAVRRHAPNRAVLIRRLSDGATRRGYARFERRAASPY
jgi:tetratricopeptide (TPR) repeat protein